MKTPTHMNKVIKHILLVEFPNKHSDRPIVRTDFLNVSIIKAIIQLHLRKIDKRTKSRQIINFIWIVLFSSSNGTKIFSN